MAKLYDKRGLIRTELSVLIGLWLKSDMDLIVPEPSTFQELIEKTDNLMLELHQSMLVPAHEDFKAAIASGHFGPESDSPLGQAAAMREAIFYAGESAFVTQYTDFAECRFADDAEWLVANYGFSVAELVAFLRAAKRFLEKRFVEASTSLLETDPSQWTLLPSFCFTPDEAYKFCELSSSTTDAIIRASCVSSPSGNRDFVDPFSPNIGARIPLVRLNDDRLVYLQEYVGAEFAYSSPSYWMREDSSYAPVAAKHRGAFAERLSYELFARAFPTDRIHQNVVLRQSKSTILGEIDLLLVHGKRAFVVQVKSKGLTASAKAGEELAISKDFSAAVQASYDQAVACIRALKRGVTIEKLGASVDVPGLDLVEEYYPICLTSEHYPSLFFQVRQFLRTVEEKGINNPIVTDMFTLDAMTEFLRTPLYLVDYLAKRSKLYDRFVSSHELNLLAYHLKANLFVPDDVQLIALEDDFMIDMDLAMMVRRSGLPGPDTPPGMLTRDMDNPLGRILVAADKSDRPDVHQIGEFLLNLHGDTWSAVNRQIEGLFRQSIRDGNHHDISIPLDDDRSGLSIHVNRLGQQDASNKLRRHCEIRKYAQKADRWFGANLDPVSGEVRFMIGQVSRWRFRADLEDEAREFRAKSSTHWIDLHKGRLKPGRNDRCPCGSGAKYEKCCLEALRTIS